VYAGGPGAYVAGSAQGALPGHASAGGSDAFVAVYDKAGSPLWSRQLGTPASDVAFGVSGDAGGAYVAGDAGAALPGQASAGGDDAFLARFRATADLPPAVGSLAVSSSGPRGTVTIKSVLTAHVTGSDPDGEAVRYAYQWYRNGIAVAEATTATLDLTQLDGARRGDRVTVTVTPSDGSATGAAVSASVTVVNSLYATAAFQALQAGASYAYTAYLSLRTPAAYTAYLSAARARSAALRAYTVDPGDWGKAASYAVTAYQQAWGVYQASRDRDAYLAYLSEYAGWLSARAAVLSP
jgi:hypothetical protein